MTALVSNFVRPVTAANNSMDGLEQKGDILIHWRIDHIGFTWDIDSHPPEYAYTYTCIYMCM